MSSHGVAAYGRHFRIYWRILVQRPGCRETCIKYHSFADRTGSTCARLNDAISGNRLIPIYSYLILLWSAYFRNAYSRWRLDWRRTSRSGFTVHQLESTSTYRVELVCFTSSILIFVLLSYDSRGSHYPKRSGCEPQAQTVQPDLYFRDGILLDYIHGNHSYLRQ